MSPELKPCPFCGGHVDYEYNLDLEPWGVGCRSCKYVVKYYGIPKTKRAVTFGEIQNVMAEKWNRRTQ